jgi:hypothetical protein
MNEDLAIAILTVIKNGESFGFQTVFNDVRQLPEFFDLTQPDFTETWNKLKEIDCLLRHDQAHIHRGGVKLNTDKDCLSIYLKKREDRMPVIKPQPQKSSSIMKTTQKIGLWIVSNIWTFILYVAIGLAIAYLIIKLKIPH